MHLKKGLSILSTIILVCLVVTSIFSCNVAFAEETTPNYKIVFPDESTYVDLNSPLDAAFTHDKYNVSNVVIKDFNKETNKYTLYVKGHFTKGLEVSSNISNLQISNNLIGYVEDQSIKLYSIYNDKYVTEDFNKELEKKGLVNKFILGLYMDNNSIYFVENYQNKEIRICSIDYTDNLFINLKDKIVANDSLNDVQNVFINENNYLFTIKSETNKHVYKIENNEAVPVFTYENNAVFTDKYYIDYSLDENAK